MKKTWGKLSTAIKVAIAMGIPLIVLTCFVCYLNHRNWELNLQVNSLIEKVDYNEDKTERQLERIKRHFNLPAICPKHEWEYTNAEECGATIEHGGIGIRYCKWCGKLERYRIPKIEKDTEEPGEPDYSWMSGPFEYNDLSGKKIDGDMKCE